MDAFIKGNSTRGKVGKVTGLTCLSVAGNLPAQRINVGRDADARRFTWHHPAVYRRFDRPA